MSLLRFSLPSPVYSSSLRSQSHYLSPIPSQRSVSPLPISHVSASVLPNVAPRLHFLRRLSDLSFPHPCPMTVNSSILSIGEKPKKNTKKIPNHLGYASQAFVIEFQADLLTSFIVPFMETSQIRLLSFSDTHYMLSRSVFSLMLFFLSVMLLSSIIVYQTLAIPGVQLKCPVSTKPSLLASRSSVRSCFEKKCYFIFVSVLDVFQFIIVC